MGRILTLFPLSVSHQKTNPTHSPILHPYSLTPILCHNTLTSALSHNSLVPFLSHFHWLDSPFSHNPPLFTTSTDPLSFYFLLLSSFLSIVFFLHIPTYSSGYKALSSSFSSIQLSSSTAVEVCSPYQRAVIGSLYFIPWTLGYMLVPLIAYLVRPWRWLQFAYTVPLLYNISLIWLV